MIGILPLFISFILLRFLFGCPNRLWNYLSPFSRNFLFCCQQIIYWGLLFAGLALCFKYSIKLGVTTSGFFLFFYNFSITSSIFGAFKKIPILGNAIAKLIGIILSFAGIVSYFSVSIKYGFISLGIFLIGLIIIKILLYVEAQVKKKNLISQST